MAWFTQASGGAAGVAVALAWVTAQGEYNPEPIYLEVARAEYVEIEGVGHITQQLISSTGQPIPAVWTASITRVNALGVSSVLCSGTGGEEQPGQYNGKVDTYDLSEWTGDQCANSTMKAGDFAEATWTFTNEHGIKVTIGTVIYPEENNG